MKLHMKYAEFIEFPRRAYLQDGIQFSKTKIELSFQSCIKFTVKECIIGTM
jgi:hypothetical protein